MPRRTHQGKVESDWQRYLAKVLRAPPGSFVRPFHPKRPDAPAIVFFLRRYALLHDSLGALRVEDDSAKTNPLLREAAEAARMALERNPERTDYAEARRSVAEWYRRTRARSKTPKREEALRKMRNREFPLVPLIDAYASPREFFTETAPRLDPSHFDRRTLFTASDDVSPFVLGGVLQRWGVGALWHPVVLDAFLALDPDHENRFLDYAEYRNRYRAGRDPKRKDSKPRRKRPPVLRKLELIILQEIAEGKGAPDQFERQILHDLRERGITFNGLELTEKNLRQFARQKTKK